MNDNLWKQAGKLAARHYDVEILKDETTLGNPIFLARNPELPGCQSQGWTIEEAIANLADARIDYIYSLLEDKLPVPDPAPIAATTSTSAGNVVSATLSLQQHSLEDQGIQDIAEPSEYGILYRVSQS